MNEHVTATELISSPTLSDDTKHQAGRIVAAYAADAGEYAMFAAMLGIDDVAAPPPGQCLECGTVLPLTARTRRVGYAGYCAAHRKAGQS
ncbi:hypothetical protein [Nocardia sp. NBC_01388]|uniref:hypothetical protein n=1 Tax=Nocardia sp. NBC_01388 TaxID=2903596 RepID=UPI00324E391C